ncbi:hypothetical protein KAU33_08700 [Candidatus Dependentiae bacterium]|nr:hypothetical protein [Candidatus Dependentiae bacterium]
MESTIVGVNTRSYYCEDGTIIEIKAILVLREDGKCIGFIAGSGSDEYVSDYGNYMLFSEARTHFPTITEKQYATV